MLVVKAMNTQDTSTYQSYLLRLWRDNPQAIWRASVQSTATEELRHFATVDDLWAYLMAQMGGKNNDQGVTTPNATTNWERNE